MESDAQQKQEGGFKLPIELKTVIRTVQLKFVWIVVIGVISCAIGIVAALLLGSQKFEATTVLFFQPIESYVPDTFKVYQSVGEGTELTYEQGAGLIKVDNNDSSMWNRVNMVKTLPNLQELRQRLEVDMTIEQLGASISVDVARDTQLMFISAVSPQAKDAMLIANTIRDIFLATNNRMVSQDLNDKLDNLEMQYQAAAAELASARVEFEEFVKKHNIRDINTEGPKYASEILDLELNLEKNAQRITIHEERVAKIQEAIRSANEQDAEEQARIEAEQQGGLTPDEANNRIQGITQRIAEIRAGFTDPVDLERLRTMLVIAENEYTRGIITRSEYEQAKFNYEYFLAQNRYSGEIEKLEAEIDTIRTSTVVGRGDSVASSEYLKLVRVMLLENELELITLRLSQEVDQKRYDELVAQHVNIPLVSQQYIVLSGRVSSLEAETRGLLKILTQYRMVAEKEQSDFYIVNDAIEPVFPMESNKKLIAIAVTFMVFLVGFTVMLALIVVDTKIKSAPDAKQKLQGQVLGAFPFQKYNRTLLPDGNVESTQIELYRMLARPLKMRYPQPGTTFLITSTTTGEGKSTTAINLATVFGRQDEHVLLLDAQIRKTNQKSPFNAYSHDPGAESPTKGLGEYLSYRVFDMEEIISQTTLPGVDMIVKHEEAVIPDLLQSSRMRELMQELKQRYSIIIIEGPPVNESVDSEILSQYADTVLFIVACDTLQPAKINAALKRMRETTVPIEGLVVTKVQPVYTM